MAPVSDAPLPRDERALFAPFESAIERGGEKIGLEAEKFGVRADGTPLRYVDVREMLVELSERFGWRPYAEIEGGPLLALERGGASITLEPGSQFELSGSPFEDLHAVAAEVEQHRAELAALDSAKGVRWIGMGFHPYATDAALDWVPKARYPIMRSYLPTRGTRGLDMMRRTATVQANYDYASERDAVRKLQTSLALSVIAQAIFANSPLEGGAFSDYATYRGRVWLDVDNDRAGLLPAMWSPDASLGDYVRWALQIPMFVVRRGDRFIPATHMTFEQFWRDGLEGERATAGDWETHLNTLFPEVRIKRTLEVRSADSAPAHIANALPALFTGVLYDSAALEEAHARFVSLGHDAYAEARPHVARHALSAKIAGRPVAELARSALAIARQGLTRRGRLNASGHDETIHLDRVTEWVDAGRSVGQALLDGYDPGRDRDHEDLLRRVAY
jgi:glutamate--cysteine ligase